MLKFHDPFIRLGQTPLVSLSVLCASRAPYSAVNSCAVFALRPSNISLKPRVNFYQQLAVLHWANDFKNGVPRSGDFGLNVQGNNGWNVQMSLFVNRDTPFIHGGGEFREGVLNFFT